MQFFDKLTKKPNLKIKNFFFLFFFSCLAIGGGGGGWAFNEFFFDKEGCWRGKRGKLMILTNSQRI